MLNADAIKEITRMAQSEVVEIEGINFHKTSAGIQSICYPMIKGLEVFSLTQIVSFVKSYLEDEKTQNMVINIETPNRVAVRGCVRPDMQRDTLAIADFDDVHETFPFGNKMGQEEFIIKLMTQFEADDERSELAELVSSVRAEKVQEGDDNGVSQSVMTKTGVHLGHIRNVKKFWNLKTYKTFPEVEQPTIPYMLRLHQRAEEIPQFALYVCDGGKWKVDTTIVVRDWLITALKSEVGDKYGDEVIVL